MKMYEVVFEEAKNARSLHWIPDQGLVELKIEREGNEVLEICVTPIQATILLLFEEENEFPLEIIVEKTGCSQSIVRDAVFFWNSHKILELCGSVVISLDSTSKERAALLSNEVGNNDTMIGIEQPRIERLIESIWPMVQGMLTNLGALDLSTIHATLGMFASDDFQYNISEKELENLLENLVGNDKIEIDGSVYKLSINGV
jgi:anaphase-promoting complex subunit 2